MAQNNYSGLLSQFTSIPIDSFYKILQVHINRDETDNLLKTMMENNYLVGFIKRNNQVITDYDDLKDANIERILRIFKKNKILLNMRLIPFAE
ncbi:MAG: hypothetical protein LBV68_09030 [Spirochaetaceae bacterium]|jgi:hypothetical protein|nr:hypothetical protein [Spirochaetaceae bacterium]